ncbi:competence protein ComEA [Rhodococcus sp. OK519]|uniref:ComEA family DNA-binding protein n=1 Tax=Rhodococcus sp. OK519 TaxID=2135729 RepID=UPI000D3630B1|nr:competence protein ComEA [Rhodococcus sp. OK519]
MGTDQDRETVRRRLVAASTAPAPTVAAPGDEPDVVGDVRERAPGWLFERDGHSEPDEPEDLPPHRAGRARLTPGRRGAAALVLVGLVAAGVAAATVWRDRPTEQAVPPLPVVEVHQADIGGARSMDAPPATTTVAPDANAQLIVSVVGLVNQAGLVHLPPGSRIADALAAAGGARPGADVLGLNMAERVDDGDQILVGAAPIDGGATTVGSARVGTSAGSGVPGTATGGAGKVNLNTAGEAELDALPGVGPVTAAAIVSWRQTNGKFSAVEQLGEVDGIGPARLAKLRDLVTL